MERLTGAQEAVKFAETHWRVAIEGKDKEQASMWKQEVNEAEQKVEKAKQEVEKAEQKVEEAKQEVKEAKQGGQGGWGLACCHALSVALLLSWAGVRRHQGGSFVCLSFGGPRS